MFLFEQNLPYIAIIQKVRQVYVINNKLRSLSFRRGGSDLDKYILRF